MIAWVLVLRAALLYRARGLRREDTIARPPLADHHDSRRIIKNRFWPFGVSLKSQILVDVLHWIYNIDYINEMD